MFNFFQKGKAKLNQELLDQIEEELILSDIGVSKTTSIINDIKKQKFDKDITLIELKKFIAEIIEKDLKRYQKNLSLSCKPCILLICGTNGSGKTTTIAKLANLLKKENKKILIAAGDTFRAAATEQLQTWGQKLNIEVYTGNSSTQSTKDPAALIYQAALKAKEENFDVLIADTSGRFSNNVNLMEELQKINNVLKKIDNNYPHETILVLDGTLGQASLIMTENFRKAVDITGLIITKLDGSSKGGALLPISEQMKVALLFLGWGEKLEDLTTFDARKFAEKLLDL